MPDATVSARLSVIGAPQAIAQIKAFRGELAAVGATRNTATLAVDTAALDKAGVSIGQVRTGLTAMRGDALGAASGFRVTGYWRAVAVADVASAAAVHRGEQWAWTAMLPPPI